MPIFSTIDHFVVGDLVAFNFPFADGGSKVRICVIVSCDPGLNEVVVAYGTSNLRIKNNPDRALVVFTNAEMTAAGLHEATRFQVDRRIRVTLGDPRFKQRKALGTAKVGRLPMNLARRVGAIYDQLPVVPHSREGQGIHPKLGNKSQRPTFLGRRGAREGAAVVAA
jgi:hypothetical protein